MWLALLVLGLACYRLSLIGKGHFYWGDECCYLPAEGLLDAIAAADSQAAATHLFEAPRKVPPSRPGFVLVSVVPTVLQRVVGTWLRIDPHTPQYYDVACAFNVLVTLAVTGCVFALGRIWTGSAWFGLLIAAVYSLLANANVWIRHLVPYNESLLFLLLGLCLVSSEQQRDEGRIWRTALGGLLSAFAYACYPGHYGFVLVNGCVAITRVQRKVRSALSFALSFAAVIAAFEMLARYAGRSYFSDMRTLSHGVTMGYPKENYVFIWRYLRDVEGPIGVLLFVVFWGFTTFVLWRRNVRIPRAARAAIAAAIACYIFHASVGALNGRMVFYGRILSVYLPFLVTGAVLGLMHINRPNVRACAVTVLVVASLYSFMGFAHRYSQVAYPADFLRSTMAGLGRDLSYPPDVLWDSSMRDAGGRVERLDPALMVVADTRPDGSAEYVWLPTHEQARTAQAPFIGVNLKFMGSFRERYDYFTPPADYRLAAQALHPEVFPVTGYEGRKPWERERVRKRQYTMRIYQRVNIAGAMRPES